VLSDEKPEVRELKLTKLGPKTAEIKLTLTDSSLVVEPTEDAPAPEWLQGEIPFADLDIAHVDPAVELEGEDEDEDEEPLPPGFRIARWIEITDQETGESFPRLATIALDGEHVDLKAGEAFAATFARLAGREKPEEAPVEEAPAEEPVEALPTGAPEAVATDEAKAEEEAPAFAPATDETPAFVAAEPGPDADDSPAFAAPDDEDDDTPAFAAADEDETS
jgi:hypothetical protein